MHICILRTTDCLFAFKNLLVLCYFLVELIIKTFVVNFCNHDFDFLHVSIRESTIKPTFIMSLSHRDIIIFTSLSENMPGKIECQEKFDEL